MPNITVKLQGGLGNQLFQYAYAKKVASLYANAHIFLDTSYFNRKHIRSLEMDKYQLDASALYTSSFPLHAQLLFLLYKIICRLKGRQYKWPLFFIKKGFWYENNNFTPPNPLPTHLSNIYLGGYFQNEPEIRPIYSQFMRDFTLKQPLSALAQELLAQINAAPEAVGISIRLGKDYKRLGWPICQKAFYLAGLEELKKHITLGKIFIFSDEIQQVQQEHWFDGYNTVFIPPLSPVESLELLRACKHFVISNSTFAWWGAYLSNNPSKKIIMPRRFNIAWPDMEKTGLALPQAVYLDNYTGEKVL